MGGRPDTSAQKETLKRQRLESEARAERASEERQDEFLASRRKQRGRISLISDLENLGARTRNIGSR